MPIEFEITGVADLGRHADAAGDVERKQALIGHIVNRKDAGRPLEAAGPQQGGDQTDMPVIGVHDVGLPGDTADAKPHPRGDVIEYGKAQGVIGPFIAIGVLIGAAGAFIEGWAVEKPYRQSGIRRPAAHESNLVTQNVVECNDLGFLLGHVQCLGIARHQKLDIDAEIRKGCRQGRAHIGQPSRLRERLNFRGCEQHLHIPPILRESIRLGKWSNIKHWPTAPL